MVSFGSSSSSRYITTYFRQAFTATNAFTSMTLRLRRDDGAVIYAYGTEVARSNMPGGTISSTTLAEKATGAVTFRQGWTGAAIVGSAKIVGGLNRLVELAASSSHSSHGRHE